MSIDHDCLKDVVATASTLMFDLRSFVHCQGLLRTRLPCLWSGRGLPEALQEKRTVKSLSGFVVKLQQPLSNVSTFTQVPSWRVRSLPVAALLNNNGRAVEVSESGQRCPQGAVQPPNPSRKRHSAREAAHSAQACRLSRVFLARGLRRQCVGTLCNWSALLLPLQHF